MRSDDIPLDKNYPADAAQCHKCGGFGCATCLHKGWVPGDSPHARKCALDGCGRNIPPGQWAIYCSNECALEDA